MPKMKTHRGAAKRFARTGSGKIKRAHAYHSHILEKKAAKRKRRLNTTVIVAPTEVKKITRLIGK
jgi:large subunit ribosomal protein L35